MNGSSLETFTVTIIAAARDASFARSLQTQLTRFTLPKHLAGGDGRDGIVSNKIDAVFLNLDILIANVAAETALEARYCIVICSPNAVASDDVDEWLRRYIARQGSSRLLCYIIDGEPNASDNPDSKLLEAFPEAVRFQIDPQGQLTDQRTEPIAADSRKHADGPKDAFLKLVAGVFAVRYADLKQRARKRKQFRLALACILLVLLAAYGGYFWKLQVTAAKQLRQQSYIAAIQDAFSANNNGQFEKEQAAIRTAEVLATEGVDDTRLLSLFKFRKRYDAPLAERPFTGKKTTLLFMDVDRTVTIGLSERNSRVFIQSHKGGQTKEFPLKESITGISSAFSSPDKQQVLSLDVEDNRKVWFLTGSPKLWQVNLLNLQNGKIKTFETRSSPLKRQFANRVSVLNIGGHFPRSLLSGWVAYGDKNNLVLEDFNRGRKFTLPKTELTAGLAAETIWFSRNNNQVLIGEKNACKLIIWKLQVNRVEQKNLCATGFASLYSDPALRWIIANYKPEGRVPYVKLLNLDSGRELTLPGTRLFGFVGTPSDFIFRGEISDGQSWGLLKLNPENGNVVWKTYNAKWYAGLGKFGTAFYRETDKGEIIKHAAATGVELQRFQTDCTEQLRFDARGNLNCLDPDKQWVTYQLAKFSPQFSLKVTKNFVQDVKFFGQGSLVVANGAKTSTLSVVKEVNGALVRSEKLTVKGYCLGQLFPASNQRMILSATIRGEGFGYLDVFGKSCVHKGNSVNMLVQPSEPLKLLRQSVFNPGLPGRLSPLPGQSIAGIFRTKYQFSWFIDQNGTHFLEDKLKSLSLPSGWNLTGISTSPSRKTAVISLLRENPSIERKLILFDLENNIEQETLDYQKLPDLKSLPLFYVHGFSPDGNLLWWTEAFQNKSKIRWLAFGDSKIPTKYPIQTDAKLFQLMYSASGLFMLQSRVGTGFRHFRIRDVSTGASLWEGNGFKDVEFHLSKAYFRFGNTVIDLNEKPTPLVISYPGEVNLQTFHPHLPWAAGTCGGNICIVDLSSRLVIFLSRRKEISKSVSQMQFDSDGSSLTYVLDKKTIIRHPLEFGKPILREH